MPSFVCFSTASSSASSSTKIAGITGGVIGGVLVVIAIVVVVILQRKGVISSVICRKSADTKGFENPGYQSTPPDLPVVSATDLGEEDPYVDMSGLSDDKGGSPT